MDFLLLIYSSEDAGPPRPTSPAEVGPYVKPWADYGAALAEAGVMLGGHALHPVATARTVAGEGLVTDGPFAETREQLGGYYLIRCASMDEATAWAAKCPVTAYGRVEVRQIETFQ